MFAWGRLGDSICRLPLLQELKLAYPDVELTALVEHDCVDVFSGAPYIDKLISCNIGRLRDWRHFNEELAFLWRLRRKRFDAVFCPWWSKRSGRYALYSGAPLRIGVDCWGGQRKTYFNVRVCNGSDGEPVHLVDFGLHLARAVGVSCETRYIPVPVTEADRTAAASIARDLGLNPSRTVAMNLGAADAEHRWPVERFAAVANHLTTEGYSVAALSNPGMPELQEALIPETQGRVIALPMMSIKQLAAFAQDRTSLLVSGDTGVMHLWQAMATPVIAICGSTCPLSAPPHRMINHPEVCNPAEQCKWHGCIKDSVLCMDAITQEEVIAACDETLA